MRKTKKNKVNVALVLALTFLAIVTAGALLAEVSPYDPNQVDLLSKFLPASAEHWFGTDNFGRDIFSRIIYGSRVSILTSVLIVLLSLIFGSIYGGIAGYVGGVVDDVMMRLAELVLSFPPLIFSNALRSLAARSLPSAPMPTTVPVSDSMSRRRWK